MGKVALLLEPSLFLTRVGFNFQFFLNNRDVNKDSNFNNFKESMFKAKARTKDSGFVLKGNQG